jgi:hypothetical protein
VADVVCRILGGRDVIPLIASVQLQYFFYSISDINMKPILRGAVLYQDRCRVRPERSLVNVKSKLCVGDGCEAGG